MSNCIKISTFKDVKATEYKTVDVTWEQLCKRLQSPEVYKRKEDMPLMKLASLNGVQTTAGSYRSDESIDEVFGIEGDYDAGEISMGDASQKAARMGIRLAFYSTSRSTADRPRWRVLAPLSNGVQPEERQYWAGMLNYVLGGILAPESFTLSQSYYYGKVEGSHYDCLFTEGENIDQFDGQFDPIYPKVEKPSEARQAEGNWEMPSAEAARMLTFIPADVDYLNWIHIGMGLKDEFGDDGFELWDTWSAEGSKYNHKEMFYKWKTFDRAEKAKRVTIATVIQLAKANGYKPSIVVKASAAEDFAESISDQVEVSVDRTYTVTKSGKIEATQGNLVQFLEDYQLRYDEFRAAYMGVFDGVVRVITDEDFTRIQFAAEQAGFARVSTQMVRENVLMICSNNTFDSAIEWGNSLVWDGQERCATLLSTYFGGEESPYTNAVSMYIASAMGGRLMQPGCKADAAVVLVGAQGAGKTMAISALAPLEDSFAEINLSTRDADQSRQLRGKLIGELGELRGLRSREAEDIKGWLSRTFEEWTPKFREFTTRFQRRLTFWGSTNEQHFLNDVTGNRRWLPITVKEPNPEMIKRDREQIWAEAIYIFKNYGVLWQAAQELAEEVRDEHFQEDPLVDEVRGYMEMHNGEKRFELRQIWASVRMGRDYDSRAKREMSRVMERMGLKGKQMRVAGEKTRPYFYDNPYFKTDSMI